MFQQLIAMGETVLHTIFLELRKAYNALDRDRCLDILAGYEVVPRKFRILRIYWVRLQISENVGGNCGTVFQSHCRITQGDLLSPTIFNMVFDDSIQHW